MEAMMCPWMTIVSECNRNNFYYRYSFNIVSFIIVVIPAEDDADIDVDAGGYDDAGSDGDDGSDDDEDPDDSDYIDEEEKHNVSMAQNQKRK